MAKTPKSKSKEHSLHSRAARRGTSPPPKDQLALKAPVEETDYKPWLHNAHNAGISKTKKAKQPSRQQKLRQQKGLEHAERNSDKLEKKVADSKKRGKKINARRADWEELNEMVVAGGKEEKAAQREQVKDTEENVDGGEKEISKPELDIELPDLEQPLPIRVAHSEDGDAQKDESGEQDDLGEVT